MNENYIKKVIYSCKNLDQYNTCVDWIYNLNSTIKFHQILIEMKEYLTKNDNR